MAGESEGSLSLCCFVFYGHMHIGRVPHSMNDTKKKERDKDHEFKRKKFSDAEGFFAGGD